MVFLDNLLGIVDRRGRATETVRAKVMARETVRAMAKERAKVMAKERAKVMAKERAAKVVGELDKNQKHKQPQGDTVLYSCHRRRK